MVIFLKELDVVRNCNVWYVFELELVCKVGYLFNVLLSLILDSCVVEIFDDEDKFLIEVFFVMW